MIFFIREIEKKIYIRGIFGIMNRIRDKNFFFFIDDNIFFIICDSRMCELRIKNEV